jgi:hypothetical protein
MQLQAPDGKAYRGFFTFRRAANAVGVLHRRRWRSILAPRLSLIRQALAEDAVELDRVPVRVAPLVE